MSRLIRLRDPIERVLFKDSNRKDQEKNSQKMIIKLLQLKPKF